MSRDRVKRVKQFDHLKQYRIENPELTVQQVTEHLGVTAEYLTQLPQIQRLTPEVFALWKTNKIPHIHALMLGRFPADAQYKLAKRSLDGIPTDTFRPFVMRRKPMTPDQKTKIIDATLGILGDLRTDKTDPGGLVDFYFNKMKDIIGQGFVAIKYESGSAVVAFGNFDTESEAKDFIYAQPDSDDDGCPYAVIPYKERS